MKSTTQGKSFVGFFFVCAATLAILCTQPGWAAKAQLDSAAQESSPRTRPDEKTDWLVEFREAALQGECAVIKELLTREDRPVRDIRLRDSFHWLRSYKNADMCTPEMFQQLIDLGTDPNHIMEPGHSAISRAIAHDNIKLALFLVRRGVSLDGPHDPKGSQCIVCAAGPTSLYSQEENTDRCVFVNEWFSRGGSTSGQARDLRIIAGMIGKQCADVSPKTLAVLNDTHLSYMYKFAVIKKNSQLLIRLDELGVRLQ